MTGVKAVLKIVAKTGDFDYDEFFGSYEAVKGCLCPLEPLFCCCEDQRIGTGRNNNNAYE